MAAASDGDEASTRLPPLVCFLEARALAVLLGPDGTGAGVSPDAYPWGFAQIAPHGDELAALCDQFGL